MKLRRLDLQRSRGLDGPLVLEDLSPGFNVVVGPNGSGKSSLCRGIAALLWETDDFQGAARGEWEFAGEVREVSRESGAAPRWGSVGDESTPPLPDAVYRGCFSFSVDDFLTDTATDGEIQRVIRTELSAGFDLARILADRKRYGANASTVSQRKNELIAAGKKVEGLRAEHRELWREEQTLGERVERLEESTGALRNESLYQDALELARARVALREAEIALVGFPDHMDRLRGDEIEQLKSLRAEIEATQEELVAAQEKALAAERELKLTGLERPVPFEELQLVERREVELRDGEVQFAKASDAEVRAVASIEAARRELRGATTTPELGQDAWKRLESVLRELQKLEARCDDLEARAGEAPAAEPKRAELPYEEALALLSHWLEGGAPEQDRIAALALVSGGALSLVLGLFGAANVFTSIGIGLVLIGIGVWRLRERTLGDRTGREAEYDELPFDPPRFWQAIHVAERLKELQRESLSFEAERKERERQTERFEETARQLEVVRAQRESQAAELAELAVQCGVPPETSRLGLTALAAELLQLTQANHEFARAQASKQEAKAVIARTLAKTNEFLAQHGLEPARDATETRSRKEQLTAMEGRRGLAERDRDEARTLEKRLVDQLERRRRAHEAYRAERCVEELDGPELARRLEQLPSWAAANKEHIAQSAEVRRLERRLETHPDLIAFEVREAQEAFEENHASAELQDELQRQVAEIRQAIERARRGRELEDAQADEESARERLADLRDELFETEAAAFLLDSVASDHQSLAQPDLLREVGRLFGHFTRHRYELRPAAYTAEAGLPFEIWEAEGRQKQFAELSSGTKSQLGLALRIAVAQSVELGEALPLVLDEALTNSDPERFRDVVVSLAELVRDGRQILFLTADDADAARLAGVLADEGLEPPKRFDLGELRTEGRLAETVAVERVPAVPQRGESEALDAYAERLGVPRLDPFIGVDSLHLFYLCSDDLDGLHEVLRERVETVGKTRKLLASDATVWRPERRTRFEALRTVAASWLDHWGIGRAPVVPPEELREGPAGTTKFIEDLVEISLELGGDARALVDALELPAKERDPRLKGFRKAKLEELKADLEARGYFTQDEPLGAEPRLDRCLQAAQTALESGALTREDVVQLANAFEQWA